MIITRDPFITIDSLIEEAELRCCRRTLTRRLKKEKIMHQRAILRPLLSEAHARKRRDFAERWITAPERVFRHWIFSDEVIIEKGAGQRRGWIFRRIEASNPLFLTLGI
jgi:hypothetical protein